MLLILVLVTNAAGFILTPFGIDPSGRYYLPMVLPLTVIAALFIDFLADKWVHWLWVMPLFLCLYNAGGIVNSVLRLPPGITTQIDAVARVDHRYLPELMEFLESEQIHAGYSNYWVSYPLAFMSDESQIFLPSLPYHPDFRYTTRDNRYEPYEKIVEEAAEIAYITTHHESLNDYLREHFAEEQVSWSEKMIGDYFVFYDLSRPVRPDEIGLGENR